MLSTNNMMIQHIISKLIQYQFRVLWISGKTHHIADALSRFSVFKQETNTDVLVCSVLVAHGDAINEDIDPALERLIKHTEDEDYQKVYETIKDRKELIDLSRYHPAHLFLNHWYGMSTEQALPKLILYHGRIMIPKSAKQDILDTLHIQHCREGKSLANASQLYIWAGMSDDIKRLVLNCQD